MRELEIEYRYLSLVEKEAQAAHIPWLEQLARDLQEHLQQFYDDMLREGA